MKRIAAIAIVVVLAIGVTALIALAREAADRPGPEGMVGPPEGEEMMGPPDPELAPLLADILILRVIVNAQLTRDQIRQILPILERVRDEEKAFRGDLKSAFLAERERLLAGSPTVAQMQQSREAIRARGQQFRAQTEQARAELAKVLSPEQAGALSRLMHPSLGLMQQKPAGAPGAPGPGTPGPRARSPRWSVGGPGVLWCAGRSAAARHHPGAHHHTAARETGRNVEAGLTDTLDVCGHGLPGRPWPCFGRGERLSLRPPGRR